MEKLCTIYTSPCTILTCFFLEASCNSKIWILKQQVFVQVWFCYCDASKWCLAPIGPFLRPADSGNLQVFICLGLPSSAKCSCCLCLRHVSQSSSFLYCFQVCTDRLACRRFLQKAPAKGHSASSRTRRLLSDFKLTSESFKFFACLQNIENCCRVQGFFEAWSSYESIGYDIIIKTPSETSPCPRHGGCLLRLILSLL